MAASESFSSGNVSKLNSLLDTFEQNFMDTHTLSGHQIDAVYQFKTYCQTQLKATVAVMEAFTAPVNISFDVGDSKTDKALNKQDDILKEVERVLGKR